MLPLLQQGRSNAQIALALQVGVETVRTHARNIYRKLGVSSRRELRLVDPSDPEGQAGTSASPARRRAFTPAVAIAARTRPATRLRLGGPTCVDSAPFRLNPSL